MRVEYFLSLELLKLWLLNQVTQVGLTFSYFKFGFTNIEKKLHKNIYTKFTYTVDPFSYSNLGLGLSMQLGVVNTYIAIDNLLNFSNLYDAQSASLQFGLNIIVNHKN